MRPIYSALGTIAACAIASGDGIVRVIDQSDPKELGITIDSDGQWINFVAQPHQESITVIANHRLSAFENYPIQRHVQEEEGAEAAEKVLSDTEFPQYTFRLLTFVPENSESKHFDGIQMRGHLYPYDDDFRLKEYVALRNDLRHYTPNIFDETLAELGHDLDEAGAAGSQSDMDVEESDDSPAFQ